MIVALLPAAGRSRRMGQPKLLLPYRGRTVLEQVVATLHLAGIEHIVVVTPPDLPQLARLAHESKAIAVELREQTPDMRATVEAGLAFIETQFHPSPSDDWLLIPADHPTLSPQIIQQLRQARASQQERSVFVPVWNGKRGHPTLIRWSHVAGIRALPANQGINAYLRQQETAVLEVPATSADVLLDLDTPEDYQRLVAGQT